MPPSASPLWAFNLPAGSEARFRRLRTGLLVLFWATAALGTGVVAAITWQEHRDANEMAERRMEHLARALEQHVARLLDGAGQFLLLARGEIETRGGSGQVPTADLERMFATQRRHDGALRPVLLFNAAGERRPVTTEQQGKPFNVAGRPSFEHHRRTPARDVAITVPSRSPLNGDWIMPITVRLDRPDGRFDGMISIAVETRNLVKLYETFSADQAVAVTVFDAEGTLFMRHPFDETLVGRKLPLDIMLAAMNKADSGVVRGRSVVDQSRRVSAYRKVSGHPLYISVSIGDSAVSEAWVERTIHRLLALAVALALVGILVALLLGQLARESAANNNLQRFKAAVDQSADLVYWISRHGRMLYTNDAAARQFGYSQAELAGMPVDLLDANYSKQGWGWILSQLDRKGHQVIETRHRRRDGSEYPAQIAASLVRIDGEPFIFAIGRDLSEQKRIEREVRDLNTRLEHRVRERTMQLELANEELESFGYAVSHDLSAPLRHLSGYAGYLSSDYGERVPTEASQLIERISERARFMDRLLQSLLQMSRSTRGPLEREDLDLSTLAASILDDLRLSEPLRPVTVEIAPGMRAPGGLTLVRNLLENLIGNAWKYSSLNPAARIEVGSTRVGEATAFFVRDNGVGFDPRDAARLFGPFQRLHRASEFEGTGVGLATAKRIVQRHGGRIWADAAPDAGATFYFTLPAD